MPDSTIPRLSTLIDTLVGDDSSTDRQWYADDQAVLVLDSTAIVLPAPPGSTDRRAFLARASLLSLAIPGVGAALAAYAPAGEAYHTAPGRDRIRVLGARKAVAAANGSVFHRYESAPPRLAAGNRVASNRHAGDVPVRHVKDTVDFTRTNDVDMPYSMDFDAAQIEPKHAFRTVTKGRSEFVIVQREFYLAEAANAVRAFDYGQMSGMLPDFVTFKGRPNQYVDAPIRVKVGDRVRFRVVSTGRTIRGVQRCTVAASGGTVFELVCDVPGKFPFVNHGFGRGQKGAIGILVVEP